jgi:hypothetical protein
MLAHSSTGNSDVQHIAPSSFVWRWLLAVLGMLTLVALVNIIVDPYEIYGWVSIEGFNRNKTQAIAESRMIKPYLIEQVHPSTLLLGSSRIEVGFDPESAAWPTALRPVLNLGLPGSGPHGQFRILQDALATTHPNLIFMGISFADAQLAPIRNTTAPANATATTEFEARLRVAEDGTQNPSFRSARIKDFSTTLLTLSALSDSILTVLNQHVTNRSRLTSLGFNTAADFRDLVRTDGENRLFVAKDREKIADLIPWAAEPRLDIESVARAITLAQQHADEVVVVIAPVQADEMEIYQQAGIIKLYDDWRRQISDIVAAAARSGKVSLWDFSVPSQYTTEALPPPGDRTTQLRWFWETNHFKPALGDLVIARIFGDGPSDFGTRITPETLPGEQAAQNALLRQFEKTHPEDVQRVAELYAAELQKACNIHEDYCRPQQLTTSADDSDYMTVQQESRGKNP